MNKSNGMKQTSYNSKFFIRIKKSLKWFATIAIPILLFFGINPRCTKELENPKQIQTALVSTNQSGGITANKVNININSTENVDTEVPLPDVTIENEHRNYDQGANVFGIEWKAGYTSHLIKIKNTNKNKSIKQLSLILLFNNNASIVYKAIVSSPGATGIKPGQDIAGEITVTGPISTDKKPETKVISMAPANAFNITIGEIFPEGSAVFRVILNNNQDPEIYVRSQYYYQSGETLKQKVIEENRRKDETLTKLPEMKTE